LRLSIYESGYYEFEESEKQEKLFHVSTTVTLVVVFMIIWRARHCLTGVVRVAALSSCFRAAFAMGSSESWAALPDAWVNMQSVPGESATLGAGCYWGTEKYIARDFAKAHPGGILATAVGFMGPTTR
jgi:hypothetical protein